jgi:hypothetical protein
MSAQQKLNVDRQRSTNIFYRDEFDLMYDLVLTVLQPLHQQATHVALHLMPYLSPQQTYVQRFESVGNGCSRLTTCDGRVSRMLRRRLERVPGYTINRATAARQYSGVIDDGLRYLPVWRLEWPETAHGYSQITDDTSLWLRQYCLFRLTQQCT